MVAKGTGLVRTVFAPLQVAGVLQGVRTEAVLGMHFWVTQVFWMLQGERKSFPLVF